MSIFGLESCLSALKSDDMYSNRSPTSKAINPQRYYGGWNTEHRQIVRVDVHPDGRVVFADTSGIASGWIALDSISFKVRTISYILCTYFLSTTCTYCLSYYTSAVCCHVYNHSFACVLQPATLPTAHCPLPNLLTTNHLICSNHSIPTTFTPH